MKNLTEDQIQLILTLFQLQNAERDITDFVPTFYKNRYGFSQYKKIGDLDLVGTDLKAADDDGFEWSIIFRPTVTAPESSIFHMVNYSGGSAIPHSILFDIMKHISF